MKIQQSRWTKKSGWFPALGAADGDSGIVFLFGSTRIFKEKTLIEVVRAAYPKLNLIGCSTAGEIAGTEVTDDSLVVSAIQFEKTNVKSAHVKVGCGATSRDAGEQLGKILNAPDLRHVIVISKGLNVNGSLIVEGLSSALSTSVGISGGLAGDGASFSETFIVSNDLCDNSIVAAIGLYGDHIRAGCASLGGWDPFGPERLITRSDANVLYELDGKSALELYKTYLGEEAKGLPGSGLLFPLSIRGANDDTAVVRTILAVDEQQQSITFAGDVPQGMYARFMKANFDRLIDGAAGAARVTHQAIGSFSPEFALLISCVGRKMVLQQRIEEEVEAVRDVLGDGVTLTGFYSYGEISPFTPNAKCELHNQTMTITALAEV